MATGLRTDGVGADVKLALGVLDVGYSDAHGKGATTTGEVAEILEDRFHVMETFATVYEDFIAEELTVSTANALDSLSYGAPSNMKPTKEAEQAIEAKFRHFLDLGEMSTIVAGLSPELRAALGPAGNFGGAGAAGISHRKKHPYSKKNKARPAFIDTGLYQASFRAWVEK